MSKFTIYPAIDIRGGKCVRLMQGDYDKETIYGDSPYDMAASFENKGADWIHMVDLDGAKEGHPVNHADVIKTARELSANIQIGGGIRRQEDIETYLEAGVSRVILGSSAISDPEFVKNMLHVYGGKRIAIGIDARDGYVATHGWLQTSQVKAEELGKVLAGEGAETFIMTDISRDGMLSGPNVAAIASLGQATNKQVIASGGVSDLTDLKELLANKDSGIAGAIIGKALYTDRIHLEVALKEVNR
ncbi:1-(5-phosphoribosyl)-5-[(5-phosphoribosylamino)methylideneamino]imidazole-4-carboxamide isomerase [Salipaludibacillus agaradhaerens]|uniref:1-(5-phosphoribosyl)-5-[(5- phosphoribosylamino)methylideneamino]imidazole-4- carboxamide isomerase n=1 Tax=Salipaludibacillus agaradhaerens TaxID=76935 RepID=UPI002151C747|nr:1-(5-phosphoribosyl)-5-[(5-phosphoribosylamino)methylideneamino]imidazole-4-carboxamide isomerase [Salipaludibacillus agaradhaerens]MCR6107946.1 1-(5-phosphoribosyl)-5-[(5-phosphoribosylamino)methylideneamino]imidazole-4-carboxamide isomerase [Salipaludibacillus agaradhaerens]MCR6119972.1 1-(5-phosphoribosyl)-5-[(5-phosphoribosylamino)methylideneamino]imidazole-4-carboxamide isomerase [Salipaludibacillus agaradhaerens]UJW59023.1 1-(5-phosphoribosyl)-5-[(5-phosphoribosylamino)methylideneamino]